MKTMQRKIQFAQHEFYHVYNRGVDKRQIFLDPADYHRFLELLFLANCSEAINVRDTRKVHTSVFLYPKKDRLVSIGAYCLMPNHFHLLITPLVEGGISTFMNKLSTGYSMYFNKRYERTGSLFQGRYKAQHADSDEYLKYLYAYIHLNPVKLKDREVRGDVEHDREKTFSYAANYGYSSLPDYLYGNREERAIISPGDFPAYFSQPEDHRNELFDWLTFEPKV